MAIKETIATVGRVIWFEEYNLVHSIVIWTSSILQLGLLGLVMTVQLEYFV